MTTWKLLTQGDMYDGGIGSQSERWRLRNAGGYDTVQKYGIVRVIEEDVDWKEVTAMGGEVVVDSETTLNVERLRCGRLNQTQ